MPGNMKGFLNLNIMVLLRSVSSGQSYLTKAISGSFLVYNSLFVMFANTQILVYINILLFNLSLVFSFIDQSTLTSSLALSYIFILDLSYQPWSFLCIFYPGLSPLTSHLHLGFRYPLLILRYLIYPFR